MPRPKDGYKNAAGQKIPGVSDITGRFMDRSRIIWWAFNRGKQGHPKLYDDSALDIGTAVHMMAEMDLRDQPDDDIEFYLQATLREPEHRQKAATSFAAWRAWRAQFHVEAHAQEASLVSETLQYGGTLDIVAKVRNSLALIDIKTTSTGEVYEDHLLQLVAYGILWEETHPGEMLGSYHLILLPKDGGAFIHREYSPALLQPYRSKFWLYRKAIELESRTCDPKVMAGIGVTPSPAPTQRRKRALKTAPTAAPAPTMADILRTYGHVRVA